MDAAHGRVSRTHTAAVKRLRVAWGVGWGRGGPLGASRAGLRAQTERRWALSSRGVLRAHAVHISREGVSTLDPPHPLSLRWGLPRGRPGPRSPPADEEMSAAPPAPWPLSWARGAAALASSEWLGNRIIAGCHAVTLDRLSPPLPSDTQPPRDARCRAAGWGGSRAVAATPLSYTRGSCTGEARRQPASLSPRTVPRPLRPSREAKGGGEAGDSRRALTPAESWGTSAPGRRTALGLHPRAGPALSTPLRCTRARVHTVTRFPPTMCTQPGTEARGSQERPSFQGPPPGPGCQRQMRSTGCPAVG